VPPRVWNGNGDPVLSTRRFRGHIDIAVASETLHPRCMTTDVNSPGAYQSESILVCGLTRRSELACYKLYSALNTAYPALLHMLRDVKQRSKAVKCRRRLTISG